MKRTLFLGLALSILGTSGLMAQDKITVKGGNKFDFTFSGDMNVTQSMAGQEMTVASTMNGGVHMMANKVGKDEIDWSYGVSDMKVSTKSEVLPGGGQDTTITMEPVPFRTDMNGKIKQNAALGEALQMFSSGVQGFAPQQMFSPAIGRSLKKGQTWEESSIDTVHNPMMGDGAMVIERTTRYTYDGPVDTLKNKAIRIRSEITSMSLTGSASMMGMDVKIDGDGSANMVSYYGAKDGILLATIGDNETNMRMAMTGQAEMLIPITMSMTSRMVRK